MMNLTEWDEYLKCLYIPLDIFLVLVIIVGVFGNGTVIYVYGYKIKKIKDGQCFIPFLAVGDLIGSVVCPLFALSTTLVPVKYNFDVLCKLGTFLCTASIFISVFFLFTIAIQRYNKICKRTAPMQEKRKKIIIAFDVFWAFLLASPSLTSTGIAPIYNSKADIKGSVCGPLPGLGPDIYNIILAVAIPVCSFGFILVYVIIAVKTIHSRNQRERLDNGKHRVQHNDIAVVDSGERNSHAELTASVSTRSTSSIFPKKRQLTRLQSRNKQVKSKITVMFMVITLAFIICSLPKYTISMFEKVYPKFWEQFTDKERLLLKFVHYGYIILFIVNPFIYALHDYSFRKHLPSVCKLFCRS